MLASAGDVGWVHVHECACTCTFYDIRTRNGPIPVSVDERHFKILFKLRQIFYYYILNKIYEYYY